MPADPPASRGRVVLASRIFAPEVAAAAFRLRVLAEAFREAGLDVEVVTTTPPEQAPPVDDGGLAVSRRPALRDSGGAIRGYVQYLSYDMPLLGRLLSRPAPRFYVCEPPPTTGAVVRIASALRRRPYVYYAADLWSEAAATAGAPRPVVRALRIAESAVLRGAAVVLSVSPELAERLAPMGVRPDRVVTVGNGVDTSVFRPDGPRADSDTPYVVYAGTMSEWQGAEVFVEALARHREQGGRLRAVFLGQGAEEDHLRRLAADRAPGAVDFLGLQPPEVAASWLRGAAAAIVSIRPGIGYDFARPTKVYAATACGTPVVFAGPGAARDLVRSAGLGWAVEHDVTAVAAAFDAVLDGTDRPTPEHLVAWTAEHASLTASARRAVEAVLARI